MFTRLIHFFTCKEHVSIIGNDKKELNTWLLVASIVCALRDHDPIVSTSHSTYGFDHWIALGVVLSKFNFFKKNCKDCHCKFYDSSMLYKIQILRFLCLFKLSLKFSTTVWNVLSTWSNFVVTYTIIMALVFWYSLCPLRIVFACQASSN